MRRLILANICLNYCRRPGWWAVAKAARAVNKGYAGRMMLEMSPELSFGVLSPAFSGNKANLAMQVFADQGCTFLIETFVSYSERACCHWNADIVTILV
jgi:hypothetical protein